jgi:peptidoglycan/LPS O-acetylase OafA/YrhL
MGAAMSEQEHKLFSSPLSSAGGFRRGDSKTWFVLLTAGAIAVVIALIIEFSFEKPGIRWPSTQAPVPAAAPSADEPRSYDVAPPGAVPPPD